MLNFVLMILPTVVGLSTVVFFGIYLIFNSRGGNDVGCDDYSVFIDGMDFGKYSKKSHGQRVDNLFFDFRSY